MNCLNPNNPVSRASMDQWHKIAALIMHKLGVKHVEIREEDVVSMPECNIAISDDKGYIEVRLLTLEESEAVLKKFGGRPQQS